jgi:hypothetical protein
LPDGVNMPRMVKASSEGFDPAWTLLLFCEADGSSSIAESSKEFNGISKWARLGCQRPLRQGAPEEAVAGRALEEYPDAGPTESSQGTRCSRSRGAMPRARRSAYRKPNGTERVHHG